jgi:hypothetical protein
LLSFGAESFVFHFTIQRYRVKIYRTVILPDVLYGCETWSLTLREEHRLRVFDNRVPRRIFGSKRDEVRGTGEEYTERCTAQRNQEDQVNRN